MMESEIFDYLTERSSVINSIQSDVSSILENITSFIAFCLFALGLFVGWKIISSIMDGVFK